MAPPRKNVITVAEALVLAVTSYVVVGIWREVIEDALRRVFGKQRVFAGAAMTAVLAAMFCLFRNIDVGKTSLYELQ